MFRSLQFGEFKINKVVAILGVLTGVLCEPVVSRGGPCTPTVTIDAQPSVQSACQGATATFSVAASSTNGAPTYQWQVSTNNGATFNNVTSGTGATEALYTTATLALSEHGNQYRVLVDDATVCAVTSIAVGLTVNPLPNPAPFVIAANSTICAGQSTTISVLGPQVGVNYQLRNSLGNISVGNPVPGGGGAINLPTGPVNVTTNFNVLATFVSTGCSQQLNTTQTITVNPLPDSSLVVGATSDAICSGTSTQVTVAGTETGVSYQLRNNSGNGAVGAPIAGNGGTIQLPTGVLNSTTTFNVFATVNSTGCAQQLSATKTITVTTAPDAGLAVGATASTICPGNSSTITVVDSVVGVTYQLRRDSDNSNVGGAVAGTGGTIELPTGVLTATTTFNVLATVSGSTCSEQLSATQTITVDSPPDNSLDVGATDAAVCPGTATNITVAGSVAGVSYQLRNNLNDALVGSSVAGTGGTIQLPTGSLTTSTTFNVLATTDATGCVAELLDLQTVTIQAIADFKSQPAGRTVCEGVEAEFSAVVEGTDLSFQWQVSTDAGATFTDIPNGGTSATFKTGATKESDSGNLYRVLVKDACGTYPSVAATLTVRTGPVVTKNPDDAAAEEGQSSTFSVVATSLAGPLKYNWQVSKDDGASYQDVTSGTGANAASYVTGSLSTGDNGNRYRVVVSNECGTVTSGAAVLQVSAGPPVGQPNPLCSVCGIGCSFSIAGIVGGLMTMRKSRTGIRKKQPRT